MFDEVERVEEAVLANPSPTLEDQLRTLLEASRPLLHLAAAGVKHDYHGEHDRLWIDVLQRLLDVRQERSGQYTWVNQSQHYPAQLLLFAVVSVAVSHRRDELLLKIHEEVHWHHPSADREVPVLYQLNLNALIDSEQMGKLPRWGGRQWVWPADVLIRQDLREVLRGHVRQGTYDQMMDDGQYRVGLLQLDTPGRRPNAGAYANHTKSIQGGPFQVEERLSRDVIRQGTKSPWKQYLINHAERYLLGARTRNYADRGLTREEISSGIQDMHEVIEAYSEQSW